MLNTGLFFKTASYVVRGIKLIRKTKVDYSFGIRLKSNLFLVYLPKVMSEHHGKLVNSYKKLQSKNKKCDFMSKKMKNT